MHGRLKPLLLALYGLVCLLALAWLAVLWHRVSGPVAALQGGSRAVALNVVQPGEQDSSTPSLGEVGRLLEQAERALAVKPLRVSGDLRDPFRAPAGPVERPRQPAQPPPERPRPSIAQQLRVEAILWSPQRPMAVVNGRLVRPGDPAGRGVTVDAILPTAVQFRYSFEGEQYTETISLIAGG